MHTRSSKKETIFIPEIEKFCKDQKKLTNIVKDEEMNTDGNENAYNENMPRQSCMASEIPVFYGRTSIIRPTLPDANFRIGTSTLTAVQGR